MKKLVLLFVLYISCIRFAGATGQAGEVIIIGQDTLQLLSCPIEVDSVLSLKVSTCADRCGSSTGCWRGYIGWWRLENGTLYLEKLVKEDRDSLGREILIDTKDIFDAYNRDGKIVASWFTGGLRVVKGECISYTHMDFWRDYEEEWIYRVEQGKVVSRQVYHNVSRKAAISSGDFIMWVADLFNGDQFPELKDKHLFFKARVLPRFDGSIDSMNIEICVMPSDSVSRKALRYRKWIKNDFSNPYTKAIKAYLELLPEWDYLSIRDQVRAYELAWDLVGWEGKGCKAYEEQCLLKSSADELSLNDSIYRLREHPLQYDMNLFTRLRSLWQKALLSGYLWKYFACWEIRNDRLYLVSLHDGKTKESIPLSYIFPQNAGEPVEASWYTGKLLLQGKGPLGQGFPLHKIYREEIVCEIEKGKIVRQTRYDNFFKEGNEKARNRYEKEIENFDWKQFPDLKDKNIDCQYRVYPRMDGTVDSVCINIILSEKNEPWKQEKIEDPRHPYVKICRDILGKVPSWEVILERGEVRTVKGIVLVRRSIPKSEEDN
ncbi:hypothetical protein [Butyricimonas hominis]|jgi:hypothetical protein|uniref:DUF3857 domain-containing protein n=1 Tax=Butyricimonas hominis TaxID=2763032 RepID=A0ABR7D1F3_9BACT|nr:hypothetical protein [Butyricimonas hominis]MBC5621582.1 hypothetical protein [Butyricimonas hominis]